MCHEHDLNFKLAFNISSATLHRRRGQRMERMAAAAAEPGSAGSAPGVQRPVGVLRALRRALPGRGGQRARPGQPAGQHQRPHASG